MIDLSTDQCQMSVAPERGAIVTSLAVDGQELLYLDQATFDDPSKNVRGGIPVLFPICGPLAGPDYHWNGGSFSLHQHGFARSLAWQVLDKGADFTVLELTDSAATRLSYPFSFRYTLIFRLLGRGLKVEQTIENLGSEAMPVQFGFHPYFLVSDKEGLCFDLPVTAYRDNKSEDAGRFESFDFSREEIDWAFAHPTCRKASFTDPKRQLQVTLSYGEPYQALVFWTLKGLPYVCLEPWSSSRLAFPSGSDVHKLDAGGRIETFVAIEAQHA